MAEEQEYTIISKSVAKAAQLNLGSDIPQIDPSTQADNHLKGSISTFLNNQFLSQCDAEVNNFNEADERFGDLAESGSNEANEGLDELAESIISRTCDQDISITSKASSLNYGLSKYIPNDAATAAAIDTDTVAILDTEVNAVIDKATTAPIYTVTPFSSVIDTAAFATMDTAVAIVRDTATYAPIDTAAFAPIDTVVATLTDTATYAPNDRAVTCKLLSGDVEVDEFLKTSAETRGSKRKLSSDEGYFGFDSRPGNISAYSVFGSGTSSDINEPFLKLLKPSQDPVRLKVRTLADEYIKGCSFIEVTEFFRNKDHDYFNRITLGIMEKYLKVNDSDPHCAISGKLEGLFFMCSPDTNSPPKSPFGPKRLILPANRLLNAKTNLYFSNFFCLKSPQTHYISLVITMPNSEADTFCQQNLIELDKYDNPYLKLLVDNADCVQVVERSRLYVEICYTEDIDISDVPLEVGVRNSGSRFVECKSLNKYGKFASTSSTTKRYGCSSCNP